jgi:hypothetical protein
MQSIILIYSPSINLMGVLQEIFSTSCPIMNMRSTSNLFDRTKGKKWTHTIKLRPNLYIIDIHRNLSTPMYTPWVRTVYTELQNVFGVHFKGIC